MSERFHTADDFDDGWITYNEGFEKTLQEKYGVELGPLVDEGTYKYSVRFPKAYFRSSGRRLSADDFEALIDRFTREDSVDVLVPKEGIFEHLEHFATKTRRHIVTSRPKEHRGVTVELLRKYFSDYITDFDAQLFMPDAEPRIEGKKITKAAIAKRIGAVAVFDDHLGHLLPLLENGYGSIRPFLFRDRITTWNHGEQDSRIYVVEGWHEATDKLEEYLDEIRL